MPIKEPPISVDQSVPSTQHRFFPHEAINADLWDKYTPYQLLMVIASEPDADGNVEYQPTTWRYTLPIPPQELGLDTPIAVNLQATLTGVSIQHGGAPFKTIQLSGTTGITPFKNRGAMLKQRGIAESILAGTIASANVARSAAQQLANGFESNPNVNEGIGTNANDPNRIYEKSTGYYQMRLMERFIESYVQLKTDGAEVLVPDDQADLVGVPPQRLRLAFCMWKDQAVYLVEPLQFTKRRTVSSPMEYNFTLQLRAYKRITLARGLTGVSPHEFVARKPALLSAIFNRFRAARKLLTDLVDVLEAIISDPVNLTVEAIRETSLFLAEVSGAKAAIADLPRSIQDETLPLIQANWKTLRNRFQAVISPELDRAMLSGEQLTAQLQQELDDNVTSILNHDALRLPLALRKKIQDEISRAKALGRADFERSRDLIQKTAASFANAIGAGNSVFSETYGLPEPTAVRTPTDTEMDVLFALNELAQQIDHLAVSSQINPPVPTSIEYVAGLAERSGIAFKKPVSKYAVPFPHGITLERLALQYLGSANRWHEIVILNGLRTPYVDEEGFKLPLLTNGDRYTVMVSDRSNLFQGQTVWLSANGVMREKRHVLRISTISPTEQLLLLDGEPDLAKFLVSGQAQLEAFLPGTVNSQQIIYIPSDNPAPEDPRTKQIPGVDTFDNLLQVSGVDLLLTSSGDLAITSDGDCRLAFGLANIVQTVKLALSTPRGSLLQHPEYGLSVPIGTSTADVDANQILQSAREMFDKDSSFSGVRSAVINKIGSALAITLDVGVAGTSQFVPITITIK